MKSFRTMLVGALTVPLITTSAWAAFGRITTQAGAPRTIQLGVKYAF